MYNVHICTSIVLLECKLGTYCFLGKNLLVQHKNFKVSKIWNVDYPSVIYDKSLGMVLSANPDSIDNKRIINMIKFLTGMNWGTNYHRDNWWNLNGITKCNVFSRGLLYRVYSIHSSNSDALIII